MSSPNHLEINGRLLTFPLAELLTEIHQSGLSGSIRVAVGANKTVIYFKEGEVVFAVSNQRQHRIFEILLVAGALTKEQLVKIPEFTNDFALAKALQESNQLPESAMRVVFLQQVEAIVKDGLTWPDGIWTFSALARIKDDICYQIELPRILSAHVRTIPQETITKRFKSFEERFKRIGTPPNGINLVPQEAFLLSRFEQSTLTVEQIKSLSGLSDFDMLQRIYILWMSGFLIRENFEAAFPESAVASLRSSKFEIKKHVPPPVQTPLPVVAKTPVAEETPEDAPKAELTLETYLAQIESAETHYASLGISHKAEATEIKMAYFNLAKRFHPDMYHKQTDAETHRRIQHAFTEIAQAYETLRNTETRQTYDFKLRKLLAEMEKMSEADKAKPVSEQKLLNEASEVFEQGFSSLMEEEYDRALTLLARATTMAPTVAKYRAYYGKALSADKNQRFKAEAEMQAAIKMEPDNATHRIMLAEFFIQYNLKKRAEGELNRLLAVIPDSKEAKFLLDSLQQSS